MKNPFLIIAFLFCAVLVPLIPASGYATLNSPLAMTLADFRQVPCMEEDQYQYHKGIIRALSYSKMRALRAFCTLPEIKAEEAIEALKHLVFYPLTFDQVRLLESFFTLPGVSADEGWQLLDQSSKLEFTAMQSAAGIGNIEKLSPDNALYLIKKLGSLDDSGRWTAKALFDIQDIDATTALAGINIITGMSRKQRKAAEKGCILASKNSLIALEILQYIRAFTDTDAVNIEALFSVDDLSAETGLYWLRHYFSRSNIDEEKIYYSLTDQQKSILLLSFSDASDYLIWKINNLHAVTNEYGAEISTAELTGSSLATLMTLLQRLHPEAQVRYGDKLRETFETGRHYDAAGSLKKATALARKLTARDLTSANIYTLLSHGSELYDSSFRNILVPVLLDRIKKSFNSNLLDFLVQTDPLNNYVSDFIISCAQKGKLTAFFPDNSAEQRRILDLVTRSAFQNEQSLILFSATFTTLLTKLQPEVRTYLLEKIIETIRQPDSTFALQLRVILQYYLEKHPDLLSATDRQLVTGLVNRYGSVDLSPYITTDFARWKQDGSLNSLSIFQHDDDGRISYNSNSRNLIKNGYKPSLSSRLTLLPENSADQQKARQLIKQEKQRPGSMIGALYSLSVNAPVIIEWTKQVNGIELSHAVAVYQNKFSQRQLLQQFLEKDMEMFAQRGHSYWRGEQLLEPMRYLLKTGAITDRHISTINRFMSIGSCGGIRAYTELNKLFSNSIDILATIGTGKAIVNDPYNQKLFEIIATSNDTIGWEEIARRSKSIFAEGRGSDYLQPGSLPAILHKMMDTRNIN